MRPWLAVGNLPPPRAGTVMDSGPAQCRSVLARVAERECRQLSVARGESVNEALARRIARRFARRSTTRIARCFARRFVSRIAKCFARHFVDRDA